MGTGTRPERKTSEKGRTCVVEIPENARSQYEQTNTERRAAGLPKLPLAVILEAMITEGIRGNWKQHAEEIQRRKSASQTGRGRPRKK